jgi:membrane protein implicated in regulation of membrane protease activity
MTREQALLAAGTAVIACGLAAASGETWHELVVTALFSLILSLLIQMYRDRRKPREIRNPRKGGRP